MHNALTARKISLSALAALALLAGALFVAAPKASAGAGQCSPTTMCVWQDIAFTGNFSWRYAEDRVCHDHLGNPEIRSAWNRTPYTVALGGKTTLAPTVQWSSGAAWSYVTGWICW